MYKLPQQTLNSLLKNISLQSSSVRMFDGCKFKSTSPGDFAVSCQGFHHECPFTLLVPLLRQDLWARCFGRSWNVLVSRGGGAGPGFTVTPNTTARIGGNMRQQFLDSEQQAT